MKAAPMMAEKRKLKRTFSRRKKNKNAHSEKPVIVRWKVAPQTKPHTSKQKKGSSQQNTLFSKWKYKEGDKEAEEKEDVIYYKKRQQFQFKQAKNANKSPTRPPPTLPPLSQMLNNSMNISGPRASLMEPSMPQEGKTDVSVPEPMSISSLNNPDNTNTTTSHRHFSAFQPHPRTLNNNFPGVVAPTPMRPTTNAAPFALSWETRGTHDVARGEPTPRANNEQWRYSLNNIDAMDIDNDDQPESGNRERQWTV